MNVCSDCFKEAELKAFIQTSLTIGKCDVCGTKDIAILDIVELMDFFSELFSNFQLDPGGTSLIQLIQSHWNFFNTNDIGSTITNEALSKIGGPIFSSDTTVNFSVEIRENVEYWEKLKEELKWSKRFVTDIRLLTEELSWDSFFKNTFDLKHGTSLFRARLHHNADEAPIEKDKMHCPPRDKVSSGRANPDGIPHLYLSLNEETPLYEVRAALLDELSLGEFKLRQTEPRIKIVDFTAPEPLYYMRSSALKIAISEQIKAHLLKVRISADLSRPMRKYDSSVEYIPTQFICEFIRVFTGAEGILFRSSVHRSGKNIVIFNQDKLECVNVIVKKITAVTLSSMVR